MTPCEKARKVHDADPDNYPFWWVVMTHFRVGVVISTDEVFMLARPVDLSAHHRDFDDPSITYSNPNCWHVYLAAGNLARMSDLLPNDLPFVSYVRKNSLRHKRRKKIDCKVTNLHYGRKTESKGSRKG
jgi:hypothetical protein